MYSLAKIVSSDTNINQPPTPYFLTNSDAFGCLAKLSIFFLPEIYMKQ